MKLITRDTDYAVRALCFLARKKEKTVTVSEIIKELKIPKPFLRKIMQALHKGSLVSSSKGCGGGFSLGLSPKKIYLTEVMKIFQGKLRINECLFKKSICPHLANCSLRKTICRIEKNVLKELGKVTVDSLIKSESRNV